MQYSQLLTNQKPRQEDLILRHLHEVGTISGNEAADLYRVRDLPKRISVLKQEGHDIVRKLKADRLKQRYARYAFKYNQYLLDNPLS